MSRPRKKPTPENAAGRVLRHAAQVLEDRDWVQGTFGRLSSGMCALGAIRESHSRVHYRDGGIHSAERLFGQWLLSAGFLDGGIRVSVDPVATWNDAPGRTKSEVVGTMRKFADEMDPQCP